MQGDKKAAGGRLRFVLLEAIGKACVRSDLDPQLVRQSIAAALQ
jgi:3-dehydroquinate synthetase